jgi:hypothetical protein
VISAVFFRERASATVGRDANEQVDRRARAPQGPAPSSAQEPAASAQKERADDEYAATGMGRRTGHVVTRVWLDLENTAAQTVNIRYEFRPQLVRLGVIPADRTEDPLRRRERAQGFDGFSPVPNHLR